MRPLTHPQVSGITQRDTLTGPAMEEVCPIYPYHPARGLHRHRVIGSPPSHAPKRLSRHLLAGMLRTMPAPRDVARANEYAYPQCCVAQ